MKRSAGWPTWVALALITLGAAVLRLIHIAQVPPDPFYDAAVRSMGLSWHNFFFGAFEPGGSVSIDKPPVDLWLQVASVKLVGFSNTSLKLPEALAGTLAVPLLFLAVRRMWSTRAGLAAAVAQAVLPIEVITSRSDTMDGVMMALIVLALYLIVRANERGSSAWLLAGAAALGIAFDVKLLESLVALPGLAVLAYLGMPGLAQTAPAATARRKRGVRRRRARVAWGDAAVPRPRSPLRDRLDQRQRLERRVRVQRHRPSRGQVDRTADRIPARSRLPDGDPVRARPHPDRAALRHAPARAGRPAFRRAPGARAAARAAARHPGADRRRAEEALWIGSPILRNGRGRGRRRRRGRLPDAPRRRGRARRVAAHRHRAVQPHGAPAPPLRRGARPGRDRDARHRPGVGDLVLGPRAPDRADRRHGGAGLLRRAPALRAAGKLVDRARRRARRARVRGAGAHPREPVAALLGAARGRHARAGIARDRGDPGGSRQNGDRKPRQRRRLHRRAARRTAARAEHLPDRPPGQRALRARGRVGHRDRLADRAGRAPRRRPHDLRSARVHDRREARSA